MSHASIRPWLPLAALAGLGAAHGAAHAPGSATTAPAPATAHQFAVGERLVYDVAYDGLKVGTATMEVVAAEELRGRRVLHTAFRVKGRALLFRVNDVMESWFDSTGSSLRFRQQLAEGSRDRLYEYEIFPERHAYVEAGKPEQQSVSNPLDEGSFIYFVRTLPLAVGSTYAFPRYFKPDRNPVSLRVDRADKVRVPAGTFDAVVVKPTIKSRGIFGDGGRAELWFSSDSSRLLLKMTSHVAFGTLSLQLRDVRSRLPADSQPDARR